MSVVLAREIDQIFNSLLAQEQRCSRQQYRNSSNKEEYVLEIPLLGMSKENVSVDIQDNVLTVAAKKSENSSSFVENFKNSWSLANDADVSYVSAALENGILTVKVPKVKAPKRSVTIM
jgi:HSP20 family molecular chaperone IbpA